MGRQWSRPGDRAGGRQQRRPDARLHEPRGAREDRRAGRGGLLEPLARAPVEKGRGERQRPEGPGAPARLRQRRRPAEGRADRRRAGRAGDRLPHRPPFVLFQASRGRRLASRRSGLERSRSGSTDRSGWTPLDHGKRHAGAARRRDRGAPERRSGEQLRRAVARQGRRCGAEEDRRGGDRGRDGVQGRRRRRRSSPRWPTCGSTP